MVNPKPFQIELSSRFEEWWRYNVVLMGAPVDAAGERLAICSVASEIAPVGSNLAAPPSAEATSRRVTLTAGPCHRLRLLIYIMPHTLPVSDDIARVAPFEVTLRISRGGKLLRKERYAVNQWSGVSLDLEIDGVEE